MYISYRNLKTGLFAVLYESYRIGKKVKNNTVWLGLVIDKNRGIYQNKKQGIFTYDLKTNTYGKPPSDFVYKQELKTENSINSNNSCEENNFFNQTNGVEDPRDKKKVVYPLHYVLLVIVCARCAKAKSDRDIEAYWATCRPIFTRHFPDFPQSNISHDTIRRIIILIGKMHSDVLLQLFTEPLLKITGQRQITLDGQAIRSATIDNKKSPYFLNVFDSTNELVIKHTLVNVKTNEIKYQIDILKDIDLVRAIVTADAMGAQKNFIKYLVDEKHCDYCIAIKNNQPALAESIRLLFDNEPIEKSKNSDLQEFNSKIDISNDAGHGRVEKRTVKVLPSLLLTKYDKNFLKDWAGLENGCIIEVTSEVTEKNTLNERTQKRYYISSLNYDCDSIAHQIQEIIRNHWHIENKLHWVLDVTFRQDNTQCLNAEYLIGSITLNKIAYNITTACQNMLNEETGVSLSKPSMMSKFALPGEILKALHKLYAPQPQ